MPRQRIHVDWKTVEGAFSKPRRLHLENDKEGLFHCPALGCEHDGFASQRGCRKHVKTKHPWYIYFDTKPIISAESEGKLDVNQSCSSESKPTLPCCATNSQLARLFSSWLQSTTGGGRQGKHAEISVTRAFKFLKYCCEQSGEDEQNLSSNVQLVDYFLCSSKFLTDFLDHLESTWQMGQSGRLGYVNSIADLLDFRRFHAPSGPVLQIFSITEVYIKRARQCLAKQMRSHWTTDLDIASLESKRSWATLAELQTVIPFHLQRYKTILEECRKKSFVTSTDLTFATRFVAVFMFVRVKGCRPMTYQHLTVRMFESAKTNAGMVNQTIFKTAQRYGFNSLYFDETSLVIVNDYVQYVRPLLKPQCEYLLVNRSGSQFQKLTELLSVLVFEAIGKYIHPTRYRQIIETESVNNLDLEEQQLVSEDQKHSSNVARVHYQKLRSREVAVKGRSCMEKLRGDHGRAMDICVQQLRQQDSNAGIEVKDMETEGDGETASSHTSEGEIENNDETLRKSRVKVRFTQEEDKYLRKGIVKFGMRWTAILNCPLYKFEQSRAPTTLRMRATTLKLI
ncbi:partial [Paramuricea clavata]|uniref:Partial n=1 Tax=Paramuricea clavata TaxID=317549 RepID=A0A6S7JZ16_PARCT|nr:partial [Paramuricea clavata]